MEERQPADVLVAGAGPVGLFTALCLAERGVRVEVVDKYWRTALHSYALALHPDSLRLLDELGVAGVLIGRGHRVDQIGLYRTGDRVGEVDLSSLEGPFPFVLVVPQTELEAALEQGLRARGVRVRWNQPLMSFDAGADSVTALLAQVEKEGSGVRTSTVRASFLVGADGYHSLTRKLLDLAYADLGERRTYCLFEFRAVMDLPDEMQIVFHEDASDVLWPLGESRGRWTLQMPPGEGVPTDAAGVSELIRSRAPWYERRPKRVYWTTSVTFERRLAGCFGRGRVWLAGDAAHLTHPVGVQNVNVGLREGHDLARRLATILKNGSSMDLLRGYDAERRDEWHRLLGLVGAVRPGSKAPSWARALAGRLMPCLPASGRDLAQLLGQVGLEFS